MQSKPLLIDPHDVLEQLERGQPIGMALVLEQQMDHGIAARGQPHREHQVRLGRPQLIVHVGVAGGLQRRQVETRGHVVGEELGQEFTGKVDPAKRLFEKPVVGAADRGAVHGDRLPFMATV